MCDLNQENANNLLDVEVFVIPYINTSIPYEKRLGDPVSIHSIENCAQINPNFKETDDIYEDEESNYLSVMGTIKLSVNGKHILYLGEDITDDLMSDWYVLNSITKVNLNFIKLLDKKNKSGDITVSSTANYHTFSITLTIPESDRSKLIFAYEIRYKSRHEKGEEHLDRIKFSQMFLLESKRFFEKMLTLFPEELNRHHMLLDLEEINFVRGYLLCEELNCQQNP